ncbi:CU044_2847 family protein [Paractinoplanes rishiriensis]|uniref:Trypsin-co-occurring domain-containing protein n=1 Tax=Paractinoplanes rishiriensis TaxID=1050105 RepID=A0A919MXI3_9ACTN|nr:CU044_2847 family protein [Actinoplanes rishiriensis]GIE98933.1 hypothetical protein Ari01nite_63980 [Actinoplanes rishiriensis]
MVVVAVDTDTDGGQIKIEVDDIEDATDDLSKVYGDDPTRGPVSRLVTRAARPLFREGLDLVQECAKQVVAKVDEMDAERPDSFEMELAIKLDNKVGAKLVEVSGGAQLLVRLSWQRRRA